MSVVAVLAIVCGAGLGALLRWVFSLWLNPVFPTVPLGTLAANLVGGLLVGVATAYFNHQTHLAPEWRLFVFTGFLGGLTTFSTFSAEVVNLMLRQQYAWAAGTATVHLAGSLTLTAAGIAMARALLENA